MEKAAWFDRQERIPGWRQDLVEAQVGLCLGVGGLGCSVALELVRLGFRRVILVDKDTVDAHNLNRQVLFSRDDVGKPKVECAARALQQHNLRTEISVLHIDAVRCWDQVVQVARQCTVIFNMIDVGDYFDTAVQALASRLAVPMVLGGTYQNTMTVDYSPKGGKPCWCCLSEVSNKALLSRLAPDRIESYTSIDFIPADAKPTGASNVYVASTCANFMVAHFVQAIHGHFTPHRSIFYYLTWEIDKWTMPPNPQCIMCGSGDAITGNPKDPPKGSQSTS